MEIINRALSPEQLELARKLFEKIPLLTQADRVDEIHRRMSAMHDRDEETADRNRHERRKAAVLARKDGV